MQLLGSSSEFCPRRPRSSKRLWPKAAEGQQQQWRHRGLPVGLSRRSPVPLTSKHTSSCPSFSLLPGVSPGWLWRRRSWSFLSQDGGEPAGGRSLCCCLSLLGFVKKQNKKNTLCSHGGFSTPSVPAPTLRPGVRLSSGSVSCSPQLQPDVWVSQ